MLAICDFVMFRNGNITLNCFAIFVRFVLPAKAADLYVLTDLPRSLPRQDKPSRGILSISQ